MHRMGTSIHDIGPPDGNGLVLDGITIQCGKCHKPFMVHMQGMFELGASIWNLRSRRSPRKLFCPYCGHEDHAEAERDLIRDTRPRGGWD